MVQDLQGMIQAFVHDYLQAEAQDLQAVQELFTSFIKISDSLVGTPREQAGGVGDGEWMNEG